MSDVSDAFQTQLVEDGLRVVAQKEENDRGTRQSCNLAEQMRGDWLPYLLNSLGQSLQLRPIHPTPFDSGDKPPVPLGIRAPPTCDIRVLKSRKGRVEILDVFRIILRADLIATIAALAGMKYRAIPRDGNEDG